MLDLEALLQPISADAPSGPNIEYGAEYAELERAVAGKPERQVGGAVVPAEPPGWSDVAIRARALFGQSKDLRMAITLTRALLETQGFTGLADGLALVRGLIERHWDTFHPQMDADDPGDPTVRVSAMAALTQRDVLQAVRGAPIVTSKTFGAVSLRTFEAAIRVPTLTPPGKAAPGASAPTAAAIEAAFQQAPLEDLERSAAALSACAAQAAAVAEGWAKRLTGAGPDFNELRRIVAQAFHVVDDRMRSRARGATTASGAGADVPVAALQASPSEIQSRDDVLRAIDAISAYYARHEPSSPLPLLLQRCKRFVTMSFTDILKEMLPESIPNLQKIAGKTDA